MDDGMAIEFMYGGHDAVLEFLLGCNPDVAQHGAGELGKEAFNQVEPGAVLRREGEFKAACRLIGKPGFGLFRNVRGMIVEDQLDRGVSRISGIEQLEGQQAASEEVREQFKALVEECGAALSSRAEEND